MRFGILIFLAFILGCQKGLDEARDIVSHDRIAALNSIRQITEDPREWDTLMHSLPEYQRFMRSVDSLLAQGPSIRFWNDSLARRDSTMYSSMLLMRMSDEFYHNDTTSAVYAYFDVLPWLEGVELWLQADHAIRFAGTLGDAMSVTHSPNMARLTYQAFERAKRLSLDHGDTTQYHLADSSYKAVARQVLTMPDSVRAAFGPPPDRPARIPWVLATLAAAFIAASVTGGWRWKGNA